MGLLEMTMTKVILVIALFGLAIAGLVFLSKIIKRMRENRELNQMQEMKEAKEDE